MKVELCNWRSFKFWGEGI